MGDPLYPGGSNLAIWLAGSAANDLADNTPENVAAKSATIMHPQIDLLRTAVRNFNKYYLWVGLLENYNKSMALLDFQLDFGGVISRVSAKVAKKLIFRSAASLLERELLRRANPIDMALYTYISAVQKARLEIFERSQILGKPVPVCNMDSAESTYYYPFFFNGSVIIN